MSRFETKLGDSALIIETGKYAKQAAGSCTVQLGNTVVLVTCAASKTPREGIDFFPLTVEYQEKTYSAGKIPGGFFKREGRPTEKEILTSRLIDRPIRPLFPKGFVNEVQVIAMVLSSDGQNDSDMLAMAGASCVLTISNIQFKGPIGAVRVGRVNNEFVVNPTSSQLEESDTNIVVTGNRENILMLEGNTAQLDEETVHKAITFGHKELQKVIDLIEQVAKECGKEKLTPEFKLMDPKLLAEVEKLSKDKLNKINAEEKKEDRQAGFMLLTKELVEKLVTKDGPYTQKDIAKALDELDRQRIRELVINKNKRMDGRGFEDLREISCETGILPRTHGSGLFTRGQTQSLCVTTLGTGDDEQMIDGLHGQTYKSFMLHYNFPPFSVGEVRPMRGPGRREIGHGALAEKAIKRMLPTADKFPYTIRLVSDILESNGSSSMATVCAGTLSLMDAGVPIEAPVAGIAMGLVKEGNKEIVLTDLNGAEDHFGDMDFKVAGTSAGITAIQMDLKVEGISLALTKKILAQAKDARFKILDIMKSAISAPKEAISEYAPKIVTLKIKPEKIGELIGPGGKMIKRITAETGATVDIDDDGTVRVGATDTASSDKAVEMVKGITEDAVVGKIYDAKVKKILDFGAVCEIMPGKEGLLHISEISDTFVKDINTVVKLGDEFQVRVKELGDRGKISLSKKLHLTEEEQKKENDRPRRPKRPYKGRR